MKSVDTDNVDWESWAGTYILSKFPKITEEAQELFGLMTGKENVVFESQGDDATMHQAFKRFWAML